jgi:RNA polymerase sigma-70 factor (ECF subfamily)
MARPLVNSLGLSGSNADGAAAFADHERILQLQAGSEDAFHGLVSEYAAPVYRLACRLLNDPADASDVVQEVFLKVYRSIGQFHGECSLKTWLYHVAVNTIWNQNRWWRRHREKECTLDTRSESGEESQPVADETPSPFELLAAHETQEIVQKALLRLSELHRMVLVLREMEDLSYEEVAAILNVSQGTVKSRLARARQSLKRELEAMMEPAPHVAPAWNPAK